MKRREITKTENLTRGYEGTKKTIDQMHKLVQRGKLDPTVQRIATWIRLQHPEDYRGSGEEIAGAIFDWVKEHGLFQRDPFQIEKIEDPVASMQPVLEAKKAGTYSGPALFAGDCDLYAIWVATLGGALGYQYAFETVKVDPQRPDEFSHVYTSLLINKSGEWLPLDASTPDASPGWRPNAPEKNFKRWHEKPVEDVLMSQSNGLGSNGLGEDFHYDHYFLDQFNGLWDQREYGAELPPPHTSTMTNLVPNEPAPHRANLKDHMRVPVPPAGETTQRMPQMAPDMVRPKYRSPIPGFHIEEPFPPGWPWSYQVEIREGIESPQQMAESAMGDSGMGFPSLSLPPSLDPSQILTSQQQTQVSEYKKADEIIKERDAEIARAKKEAEEEERNIGGVIVDTLEGVVGMIPQIGNAWLGGQAARYEAEIANSTKEVLDSKIRLIDAEARRKLIEGGAGSSHKEEGPNWLLYGVLAVVGIGAVVVLPKVLK